MSRMTWDSHLSDVAKNLRPSPIRELLKLTKRPGMISFAGGNPDPAIFPVEQFSEASGILAQRGREVLQYGPTEGFEPLKDFLAQWMAPRMGRVTAPEEMLITSGSQQGMDLLAAVLLNPGDSVLVEDPTYPGALHTLRNRGARFVTVPCDAEGMRVDLLPEILDRAKAEGHRVKFLYSIVNFQNPSGATLSAPRRRALLDLARDRDLVLFEDDPYGHLRYDGASDPTIFSQDTEGRVVYACSFSKILAPGSRVAWMVGDPELIRRMVMVKQGNDLCTSVVAQALVYEYCHLGHLDGFLPKILKHYSVKRDGMAEAFRKHLPAEAEYHVPAGGFFFWMRLPGVDTKELFLKAVDRGVAFVTGPSFFANGGGEDCLRLCFSFAQPEELEEGAVRLAEAIRDLKS